MIGVALVVLIVSIFYGARYLSKRSPTVDSIVADITNKVEQLHAVKDAKHLESQAHAAAMEEYKKLQSAALQEKERALSIAEKLTALIS